jgi:transposase-like protein
MLIPEQKTHNIIKCLENIIISLYAKGMIVSDIDEKVKELYDFEISSSAISIITNAVATEMVSCQNRPLEDLYLIGIVFDVRENSKVINKTIYLAVGLHRKVKLPLECFQRTKRYGAE